MNRGKNIFFILIFILLMGSLSQLNGNSAIALLIDPSSPDSNKVKLFQRKYMKMNEGDSGYGSFGPKTTEKWKELVYNDKIYEDLSGIGVGLIAQEILQISCLINYYY